MDPSLIPSSLSVRAHGSSAFEVKEKYLTNIFPEGSLPLVFTGYFVNCETSCNASFYCVRVRSQLLIYFSLIYFPAARYYNSGAVGSA